MGSGDSKSPTVTIRCNGADAIRRMVAGAHRFCEEAALEAGHSARLAIMVEELVTNLVEHGDIAPDGVIELLLALEDGVVAIALSDPGIAFDLRDRASGEDIPDRGGGAGIDLIKAWAEIVDYESRAGQNRLLLKMWLS